MKNIDIEKIRIKIAEELEDDPKYITDIRIVDDSIFFNRYKTSSYATLTKTGRLKKNSIRPSLY